MKASNFLTDYEYSQMLYFEPRGLSCGLCHGSTGRRSHVIKYTKYWPNNKYPKQKKRIKINPIYKLNFDKFRKKLQNKMIGMLMPLITAYLKKEVIHPQVPLRIPCDDLTPLTELRLDTAKKQYLVLTLLGWFDGQCVQGEWTYSPDSDKVRLLGIPMS